jgi:hypothetical protein
MVLKVNPNGKPFSRVGMFVYFSNENNRKDMNSLGEESKSTYIVQ